MTRLDLFIDRMVSQRACLDHAIARTIAMTGPVFELGLGNGRTYHHLRARITNRDIYVFERAIGAHPESTPPEDRVILGDVNQTLVQALARALAPLPALFTRIWAGTAAKRTMLLPVRFHLWSNRCWHRAG